MHKLFKAIYLAGLAAQIAIRMPHERRRRETHMVVEHIDAKELTALWLIFFGLLVFPLTYIFTPWLKRADYGWPERLQRAAAGLGGVLMAAAVWLFWRSHADLGRNWSPTLQLREEHALVTNGVYRRIRHPMYASQWLWTIAQPLLLQNWIAGWSSLLFLPLYFLRVPREERMMVEQFGDAYREYMSRTGRIFPRLR